VGVSSLWSGFKDGGLARLPEAMASVRAWVFGSVERVRAELAGVGVGVAGDGVRVIWQAFLDALWDMDERHPAEQATAQSLPVVLAVFDDLLRLYDQAHWQLRELEIDTPSWVELVGGSAREAELGANTAISAGIAAQAPADEPGGHALDAQSSGSDVHEPGGKVEAAPSNVGPPEGNDVQVYMLPRLVPGPDAPRVGVSSQWSREEDGGLARLTGAMVSVRTWVSGSGGRGGYGVGTSAGGGEWTEGGLGGVLRALESMEIYRPPAQATAQLSVFDDLLRLYDQAHWQLKTLRIDAPPWYHAGEWCRPWA
jgi:hypothetical protein